MHQRQVGQVAALIFSLCFAGYAAADDWQSLLPSEAPDDHQPTGFSEPGEEQEEADAAAQVPPEAAVEVPPEASGADPERTHPRGAFAGIKESVDDLMASVLGRKRRSAGAEVEAESSATDETSPPVP